MNANKQLAKEASEAIERVRAHPDQYPPSIRGFAEMCAGCDDGLSREEVRANIDRVTREE